MKAIFIAGTDTGVGKTVVTGLLARYLLDKGYRVTTQKWVQTGCAGASDDIDAHLKFMGKRRKDFQDYIPFIEPHIFKLAASPHAAASAERKRVDAAKIRRGFGILRANFDFVLVEGAGGLLVPLDKRLLLIDVIKDLKLPVLLVAADRLGVINHTLLSIEALAARKIKTIGVILNNHSHLRGRTYEVRPTRSAIEGFGGAKIAGVLPCVKERRRLQRRFGPIGDRILRLWISG